MLICINVITDDQKSHKKWNLTFTLHSTNHMRWQLHNLPSFITGDTSLTKIFPSARQLLLFCWKQAAVLKKLANWQIETFIFTDNFWLFDKIYSTSCFVLFFLHWKNILLPKILFLTYTTARGIKSTKRALINCGN